MFLHVFKYKMRSLLRERSCVCWNFLFPIALATAFFLGFGNMMKDDPDAFKSIPVAIVKNETETKSGFAKTVEQMSDKSISDKQTTDKQTSDKQMPDKTTASDSKNTMFILTEAADKEEAINLLKTGRVEGVFLEEGDKPSLTVNKNGTDQTILAEFLTEYNNYSVTVKNVAAHDPSGVQAAVSYMSENMNAMKEYKASDNTTSLYMQYFYALIGMACLYGSWVTANVIESISANQSVHGARYECAPVKKLVSICAGAAAALIIVFSSVVLLILYINFVLGIRFEGAVLSICLTALLGSMIGVACGLFIGALSGRNSALRIAAPISFSMVSSFLGGLMYAPMKQVVEVYAPFVNRINPASIISDAFYTLGMYGVTSRFYIDCVDMLIMSAVFIICSAMIFRRRSYASI